MVVVTRVYLQKKIYEFYEFKVQIIFKLSVIR